ncbi:hypothetical protein M2146_002559 [Lachnospiraceae bacterium PF1-22]
MNDNLCNVKRAFEDGLLLNSKIELPESIKHIGDQSLFKDIEGCLKIPESIKCFDTRSACPESLKQTRK